MMHWQLEVKIYPDNVHYQSKKGKSVTLAKNRTGARDAVDAGSLSRGKEGDGATSDVSSVQKGGF